MTTKTNKRKRFYKEGEFVFIKESKSTGKVVSIDTKKLEATLSVKTETGFEKVTKSFMEIDKLNITNPKAGKAKDVILFAKMIEGSDAKIPSKRHEDGCYDVYACFPEEERIIMPQTTKAIPTGIASAYSPKYRFNCKRERSSTGKHSMAILSGQLDSGYRGEWFIAINNAGNKPIVISKKYQEVFINEDGWIFYPYSKAIVQAALEYVPDVEIEETTLAEVESHVSERGTGKYGASGK